jgi:hypothetical protein
MRRPLAALLCAMGLLVGPGSDALTPDTLLTPPEHRRAADQTFLTFPEWFLVHSPAEYAAYLARSERPSAFPLFAHIGQFWQSYAAVRRETERFPFNAGYHLMILVIGTSTTVEYGLKGLYEHTIGRLAEATKSTDAPVAEEAFAARYAQAYVDFIRVDPWYKFDFGSQLRTLWTQVPRTGPDPIRKWERRFALTSELLVKEGYARLIKLGTQSLYDAPKPVTAVVLNRAPEDGLDAHPDYRPLGAPRSDGLVLATVPRYEGFTAYGRWLAAQGVDFVEIAGNRGDVVVSVLVPEGWRPALGRVLFEQPILTRPGTRRVVLALPVERLAAELRREALIGSQVAVEHLYDF